MVTLGLETLMLTGTQPELALSRLSIQPAVERNIAKGTTDPRVEFLHIS